MNPLQSELFNPDVRAVFTPSSPLDAIDALPTIFGFVPTESFIGITTSGRRRRFGFSLRQDMPTADQVPETADSVTKHLNNYASDGVIIIAVTEDRETANALMTEALDRLGPVEVVAMMRADQYRVWQYDAAGHLDETDPGMERTDATSPAVTQAIVAGQQIWGSREELEDQFQPQDNRVSVAVDVPFDPAAVGAALSIQYSHLEHGQDLTDADVITLATLAADDTGRDHMWVLITAETALAQAEMWRLVANRTVETAAAGSYCLSAFGFWLAGRGAQALMALDRAAQIDPDMSMFRRVVDLVENGVNPATWSAFAY